jgi:hypothetical protein
MPALSTANRTAQAIAVPITGGRVDWHGCVGGLRDHRGDTLGLLRMVPLVPPERLRYDAERIRSARHPDLRRADLVRGVIWT